MSRGLALKPSNLPRLPARYGALLLPPLLAGLALALLFSAAPARAAGVVGNGTPASCTFNDLKAAMLAGGLVTFNCGSQPHTIVFTATWYVFNDLTIDGGGKITLSGGNSKRLFVNSAPVFTLAHITLADGRQEGIWAGAIENHYGLVLDDVTLRNNSVAFPYGGGAILNQATGSVWVSGSRMISNSSAGGGAIFNMAGGRLAIHNSQFISNSVIGGYTGGAIHNEGTLTMTGSLLSGNIVSYTGAVALGYDVGGGGLANVSAGSAAITDTTFSANRVHYPTHVYGEGGGLLNRGPLTLVGGSFVGNSANSGGGLTSFYTTTVSGTTFSGNKALNGNGGAVHYARVGGGALTLEYSLLTGNEAASSGGGIQLSDGAISLYRSTLAGNSATYQGGGINTSGNTYVNLVQVTISGNRAYYGGGLRPFNSTVYIYDSTLSGNTGVGFGGGIYQNGCCVLNLQNVTMSGNTSNGQGGGMYTIAETTPPVLRNVTFYGNSAPRGGAIRTEYGVIMTNTIVANSLSGGNCLGSVLASKYSVSSDNTCALTGPGSQNAVDPQLSGLGNYGGPTQTHLPAAGSPVVDAIVGQDAPPWDQRHVFRPQGLGHDIGAVERRPSDTAIIPRLYLPLTKR